MDAWNVSVRCPLIEDFRFIFDRPFSNQNLARSLIKWLQSWCHICVGVPISENFGLQLHDVKFPNEIKLTRLKADAFLRFEGNLKIWEKMLIYRAQWWLVTSDEQGWRWGLTRIGRERKKTRCKSANHSIFSGKNQRQFNIFDLGYFSKTGNKG